MATNVRSITSAVRAARALATEIDDLYEVGVLEDPDQDDADDPRRPLRRLLDAFRRADTDRVVLTRARYKSETSARDDIDLATVMLADVASLVQNDGARKLLGDWVTAVPTAHECADCFAKGRRGDDYRAEHFDDFGRESEDLLRANGFEIEWPSESDDPENVYVITSTAPLFAESAPLTPAETECETCLEGWCPRHDGDRA